MTPNTVNALRRIVEIATSAVRLAEIEGIPEEAIDTSEIPEAAPDYFEKATLRLSPVKVDEHGIPRMTAGQLKAAIALIPDSYEVRIWMPGSRIAVASCQIMHDVDGVDCAFMEGNVLVGVPSRQAATRIVKERAYFYEHINGKIIRKPALVVDGGGGPNIYFDSPFVKRWWREGDNPEEEND